jgi:hypothetical protein
MRYRVVALEAEAEAIGAKRDGDGVVARNK